MPITDNSDYIKVHKMKMEVSSPPASQPTPKRNALDFGKCPFKHLPT